MKSLAFIYVLVTSVMLAGCQSFQFVDSPIPVNPPLIDIVTP